MKSLTTNCMIAVAALAQVRHETAEKSAKPFRISSGYREVSTTFRDES
jgi:hypothetical protein